MKSFLFSILFLFCSFLLSAQVGIGTITPSSSSMLDITSTNSGLLIPRIALTSSTDTVTIPSPVTSLLIYNTGAGGLSPAGYYYWNGSAWITLAGSGGTDWTITGNSGTTAGTNFIGTSDAVDLRIKTGGNDRLNISNTNGQLQSYTTSGSATTPSYSFSGSQTSTGMYNPASDNLGFSTAGTEKVRIEADGDVGIGATPNGSAKLEINSTNRGLLIPNVSLTATNVAGPITAPATSLLVYNIATAGISPNNVVPGFYFWNGSIWVPLTTGLPSNDWTILGNTNIVDGTNFIGTGAATNVDVAFRRNNAAAGKIGAASTSFGVGALNGVGGAATTSTAFGTNALTANTSGAGNVAVGNGSLSTNSTGANNTAVGINAGSALTGSNNIMIGASTVAPVAAGSDQLNIGNTIFGSMAGALTLGVNTTRTIGINVLSPLAALDINSSNNGLLVPRVALVNTTTSLPVLTATTSEIVYNTATAGISPNNVTPGFYFWNGSSWVRFATGAVTGWLTTGNSGLTAGTNFIGTTDAVDVSFKRNNTAAGFIGANSTAFGVSSLAANAGTNNTAFGTNALAANNTPGDNTAIGFNALAVNTLNSGAGNLNTAVGSGALDSLNGGARNTAVGANALTGVNDNASLDNVAVGHNALQGTGTITQSVAIGSGALLNSGSATTRSTAVGFNAGNNISLSIDSVFIGTNALGTGPTATNQIAIGSGATASGDNDIRLGNTSIDYAGIQVAWTVTSDRRWKDNIKDSGLGLNFLKTLRPVSYFRNNDVNKKTEYGFIAQELEDAFNKAGDTNNAVISKDDKGMYGVRYNDFIAITVKAVQEQQEEIEALKKANAELMKTNEAILKRLEALEK